MPSFTYSAKQKDAQTVSGRIIAEDKNDAVEKINQLGLVPVHIEEAHASHGRQAGLSSQRLRILSLYHFSRQLSNLLRGGVPVLRALEIIAVQQKNAAYRQVIESLHLGIRSGRSLSDCLQEYPHLFPSYYMAMVRAGEESGNLKEALGELSLYLKSRGETAAKVKNAFIYPALMAVLGCGSVVFILTYVLPKLSSLYKQFGQSLPGPTQVVVALSDFLVHGWLWLLVVLLAAFGLLRRIFAAPQVKLRWAKSKLRWPGVGPFLVKVDTLRFCRTLGILLKSGVPVIRAVQLAIDVVDNECIRTELEKCREALVAGRSFGDSIRQAELLPDMVGYLIAVGEESGNMVSSLEDIVEVYRQETEDALKVMTALLEPLLIIVVGSIIGLIVIAMLLPVFQLDMMVT